MLGRSLIRKQLRQHSNPGAPSRCSLRAPVKLWTAELAQSPLVGTASLLGEESKLSKYLSGSKREVWPVFSTATLVFQ